MKRKKRVVEIDTSEIEVLNIDFLRKYLSGEGKAARIVSRFVTGLNAKDQKKIEKAIKRARQLNLV